MEKFEGEALDKWITEQREAGVEGYFNKEELKELHEAMDKGLKGGDENGKARNKV